MDWHDPFVVLAAIVVGVLEAFCERCNEPRLLTAEAVAPPPAHSGPPLTNRQADR
jgi:hypothetical protein